MQGQISLLETFLELNLAFVKCTEKEKLSYALEKQLISIKNFNVREMSLDIILALMSQPADKWIKQKAKRFPV